MGDTAYPMFLGNVGLITQDVWKGTKRIFDLPAPSNETFVEITPFG